MKLPSNINLLKKLCEKINKNEKESVQPIFKFEEDENSINNNMGVNNKENDSIKKKLYNEFEKKDKDIFGHRKTSSQNIYEKNETSHYDNLNYPEFENINININKKNQINKQSEVNPECKNITYNDSICSPNQKTKNNQQYQNLNRNNK